MSLIDLSLPIEEGMPVYPGDIQTSIRKLDDPKIIEGGWLAHNVTMSLHAATHVEAPAHAVPSGKLLDQYPLETFVGEVTTITWEEIGHYEVSTPMLFVYSGYDAWWGNEKYYSAPALTPEQAKWIGGLDIKIFGNDTGSAGDVNAHRKILEHDILIIESLCNLKSLLYKKARAMLFPLKFVNMESSPVRVVAEIL
ncbi:MAG: cyclase family protein [Deltaproteobacteria bacterium]|nr:cyclase family protein [Deltaproteobacteria bacterium]